jgi:formate dehydrogenase major subunit
MVELEIDGRSLRVADGVSLLDAARANGIAIPTLCHDRRLHPAGDRRICAVELKGAERTVSACTTLAASGMKVATQSDALRAFRHTQLAWAARKVAPAAAARWPDKDLHRLLRAAGIAPGGADAPDEVCDLSHPYIRVDMSQCIDCYRCIRICAEVQGQSVWHAVGRGDETEIVPDSGTTLAASSCVGCGACADTCPTGALTDMRSTGAAAIDKWTRTTCGYCGVGCEMEVGSSGDRIVQVRPADGAVNRGHLCVKGRYAFQFTHAADRLAAPLLRAGDGFAATSWDAALDRCADEFRRILAVHGPGAIGVLGSARATNEDNYLAQKFARVVLGSNNVDCCARVCHTPTAAAMKDMLGTGAATNSFDDIDHARAILVVGANATENHPVVGARIRQRVRRGGASLIVIDPRRIELAGDAAIHLAPRPGTNLPLLNAMAQVILSEGLADEAFLRERVAELEPFRAFVAAWTAERAAADICAAARLYAMSGPAMCFHGLGVTEHVQGTEGVMALVNLALLTGNLGKPGSGINPLRGQNNVQGAAQMGCDPAILTGSVAIDERRLLFEGVWGVPLPRDRGLNLMTMIDEAAAGRLKALWITGYDILDTLPDRAAVRAALAKLDFVVVQDLFLNETARDVAHVVLPAASVFEHDGLFMNAERRIQRVRRAVPPPGEARADWEIVCDLAVRMGHSAAFNFGSAEAVWNEVRAVWPEAAGITYARLNQGGLQWPCRDETEPGQAILHRDGFARAKTAPLRRIDYVPTPERTDADYPFLLNTGRTLYHFNAGTMTRRTANLDLAATDRLDIAPADAARLGFADGDRVEARSRYGMAALPVRIDPRVKPGELFATFHDPAAALNRLTSPHRDRITQAPEYKVTAVALSRPGN